MAAANARGDPPLDARPVLLDKSVSLRKRASGEGAVQGAVVEGSNTVGASGRSSVATGVSSA